MRISDWSSDVCSSDLLTKDELVKVHGICGNVLHARNPFGKPIDHESFAKDIAGWIEKVIRLLNSHEIKLIGDDHIYVVNMKEHGRDRSEEHTSELQSLMRISYAVFCLKQNKTQEPHNTT